MQCRTLLEDLEGQGWIGAIQAVDRFDPTLGVKLNSFADRRIRGAIWDYLRKSGISGYQDRNHRASVDLPTAVGLPADLATSTESWMHAKITVSQLLSKT